MKKNWIQIVTLCLCVMLLAVIVIQARWLEEYRQQMENRLDDLSNSLSYEIQNISSRLESELEEAACTVSNYALEPVGIDSDNRVLLADVSVSLKEWYTDTQIALLAEMMGKEISMPMTADGNGVFSAQLSIPLEENPEIILDALITGGGVTKQESLGAWGDIFMLLPLHTSGGGWSGPDYQDGVMSSWFSVNIEGTDGTPVVRNPEFWIYKNGELVQTLQGIIDPYSTTDMGYCYTVNTAENLWELACEVGDVIDIRFRCEDEYGLGYDFLFTSWPVEGASAENQISGMDTQVGTPLKLYWPE